MSIKILLTRARTSWNGRFAFLHWPLDILSERVMATQNDGLINRRAAKTRYPIRAIRYWWTHCALLDEERKHQEQITIANVGCSKGIIKRFVGNIPNTKWVGLDWNIDHNLPGKCGYDEVHECDFDRPFPLPDHSVDVVVFLHIIEHLPRPLFTMRELSRILRPGGLLLAGSPVAPRWIAWAREWQFRSRMRKGQIKVGGHINSMDCEQWRSLVKTSSMDLEMLTGTFFARWSGNPLENYAWWLRLNQIWGGLFPSLGGEVYLAARKPLKADRQPALCLNATTREPFLWKRAWAWSCAVLAVCTLSWFLVSSLENKACPVQTLVAQHQDGNDTFHAVAHPALEVVSKHNTMMTLRHPHEILSVASVEERQGKDAHFLLSSDSLPSIAPIIKDLNLCVVESIVINGIQFVLLSGEGYGQQMDADDGYRRG